LTPSLFWQHWHTLLCPGPHGLEARIRHVLHQQRLQANPTSETAPQSPHNGMGPPLSGTLRHTLQREVTHIRIAAQTAKEPLHGGYAHIPGKASMARTAPLVTAAIPSDIHHPPPRGSQSNSAVAHELLPGVCTVRPGLALASSECVQSLEAQIWKCVDVVVDVCPLGRRNRHYYSPHCCPNLAGNSRSSACCAPFDMPTASKECQSHDSARLHTHPIASQANGHGIERENAADVTCSIASGSQGSSERRGNVRGLPSKMIWQPQCSHGCCWHLPLPQKRCHSQKQLSSALLQETSRVSSMLPAEGKQLWLSVPVMSSKQTRGALEASLVLLVEIITVSLDAAKTVIIADEGGAHIRYLCSLCHRFASHVKRQVTL
jgi:hypothetical protein